MSVILWILVLSSGSVVGAVISKKKYEEILPVTCSTLVLLLLLAGVVGFLKEGVYCVLGISVGMYIFAAVYLLKGRAPIKGVLNRIFTPGFWIFIGLISISIICNMGRVASNWDEFSHWADIAKVMVTLDDFGTNPEAHSAFQSYPPAMTLFQYFLQKITGWIGGESYIEWELFFAYQIFVFAFIVPFAKEINNKKIFKGIIYLVVVFLCPLWFYNGIYTTIYIDPALGILSGTGFATVFLCDEKDKLYSVRIFLTCAMLVLLKDAGMLFAALLAVAYAVDLLCLKQENQAGKFVRKILWVGGAFLSVLLPKWIWSHHLAVTKAEIVFSNPVDVKELFHVLFSGEWSYRRTVLSRYVDGLFKNGQRIGNTGIYLSYFWIAILFLVLLALLIGMYRKKRGCFASGVRLFATVCIQFAVYVIGLVIMYMFKFSEYEALKLASMERYMGIVFLSVWMTIVLLALSYLARYANREYVTGALFLGVIVVTTPMQYLKTYLNRQSVYDSIQVRSEYAELSKLVGEVVPELANVYIISQVDMGFDYWVLRYSIRPRTVQDVWQAGYSWSIGEPFYGEDVWTVEMNAEQWMNQLTVSFDYVALYQINDYFVENFADCFEDETQIEENMVYYVNKETGLLERCR